MTLIFHWYCSLSGQAINFSRPDLFCSSNIPLNIQENLANSLKVKVNLVQCPSKYLGLSFELRGMKVQKRVQNTFERLDPQITT